MRTFVVFLCLTISWVEAQNGRGPQHQDHTGHGWDIRLAVPGEPGSDYPTLGAIPRTTFSCAGREPGYYADLETNCQVFRVCTVGSTYGFQSFLCPNGTLFNQAVFVCDWWMNVDCQNSQQFFTNNDQKFENLRLGPQLMKDIKKMLTHPMRNPLEKSAMKSNLIVMQDYKPPSGQLFPNGALLAGPERPPNNVYVPAKVLNQFGQNNLNDIPFSASTPEPRYFSGQLNINPLLTQNNAEAFQKQRQNGQYLQGRTQTLQTGNLISNGHAGRYIQNTGFNFNGNSQIPRPTQNTFAQTQPSITDTTLSSNTQRGFNRPRAQYTEPRKLSPPSGKQINFGASLKPQNQIANSQNKQTLTATSAFPQFSNTIDNAAGRELNQNLVSTIKDVLSTVATRSTTYLANTQETAKVVKPKPRITIKTWIVKPTKLARLIANPTPYTYPRPTEAAKDRLVDDTTPYTYDRPTSSSTEKKVSVESETESGEPYYYTKPTLLAKQVSAIATESTRLFIAPTSSTIKSTFSERLNLRPSPSPTMISRVYLTPPTFMTNDRFYLPPPSNPTPLSRQYLPPNVQPVYYESAKLKATPTVPSPTFVPFTLKSNKLSVSPSTSNSSNLTFTDVLTKEKLDLTVNDIVKDTNDILRTASPAHYGSEFNSIDYIENDYLPTRKTTTESGENLTSQSSLKSTPSMKSSRLIATPSPDLQPPKNSFVNPNTNQLSKLPFFKESSLPNTIERTVSIKITIPERIAAYFFKNNTESDFDKLEILNTGSSNYLVLSNNLLTKNNGFNFIPIAKLNGNGNENKNISNSQALVYSFLADSINVARDYNNIATQEVLSSTPSTPQLRNMNSEDLSQITNKVSQLTSSQFSSSNFNNLGNQANIVSTQMTSNNPTTQFRSSADYTEEQNQPRQVQSSQYNVIPSQQTQQLYSTRRQTAEKTHTNLNNQIYSGQLYQWPVPDVTDQIYNRPISAELLSSQQQNTELTQQSGNLINAPNDFQQNSNFEVVKSNIVTFNPNMLHLEPPSAPTPFTSQETLNNLLNSDNGISAHLQDKIVGTITHPSDANKRVTYKKDQSYYLYTKLEDNTIEQNIPRSAQSNNVQQNTKLTQGNAQNHLSFELVPSVSYELEDEKEQEKILNAFRIDEFGAPREIVTTNNAGENINERKDVSANLEFSAENKALNKQNAQYRINALYDGPSSYSAPQSSVGSLESLEARQVVQNNFSSRLEDLDNTSDGYPKERPARQFTF